MRNYALSVAGNGHTADVVVSTIQQATGLTTTFLVKNCAVSVTPTTAPVTHKNTAYAQAYMEARLMGLDVGIVPRIASCASR